MNRRVISFVLSVAILGMFIVVAAAAVIPEDRIMPCHTTMGISTNAITTAGKAAITAAYDGYRSIAAGTTVVYEIGGTGGAVDVIGYQQEHTCS